MEEGYCVKCRDKVNFEPESQLKEFDTKRGKKYAKIGKCPVCGTNITVFTKK